MRMMNGVQGFAAAVRYVRSLSGETGRDDGDHAWNEEASLGASGKCQKSRNGKWWSG